MKTLKRIICPECHNEVEQPANGRKRLRCIICGYIRSCNRVRKFIENVIQIPGKNVNQRL